MKEFPQEMDRISRMTKDEILAFFKWREFVDPFGHPLTNDIDFLELVERATRQHPTQG